MGLVIRFQFPEDENVSILESTTPPCSRDADVAEHSSLEIVIVEGKRFMEVEIERDATTYFFIPSKFHASCSPACCFTFSPVSGFNTGTARFSAACPTATSGRSLPSATFPGTVASPPRSLASASSLATNGLHSAPSGRGGGSKTVLPPIENEAVAYMHASWVFRTGRTITSLGIALWVGGMGINL